MKRNLLPNIFVTLFVVLLFPMFYSCKAYKELPYVTNSEALGVDRLISENRSEATIMPNDIISITVNSNIPGVASDFVLPLVPANINSPVQESVLSSNINSGSIQNYLVDENGYIDFPVLGEIKLGGMSLSETKQYLISKIYPRYIAERPVINIRFTNFRVSVLGEVAKPGIYQSETGKMSLFDALAAAGDLTIYGKRNNVLLMRVGEDGDVHTYRLNLQDKEVLNKNVFYLQQNDKIYIEPNKTKGNNSRFGTLETIGLSTLSVIISVVAIISR